MTGVTRKITLDLSRKSRVRIVFASQNDLNSRRLSIRLTDDGKPYFVTKDVMVTFHFLRPDGNTGAFLMDVCDDGSVEYTLDKEVICDVGTVECSVCITDAGQARLTSSSFFIEVDRALYSGAGLSESENRDLLSDLISTYVQIQNQETARNEAEALRIMAETGRSEAEQTRYNNELGREDAENGRRAAEQNRKIEFGNLKDQMSVEFGALMTRFEDVIYLAGQAKDAINADEVVLAVLAKLPVGDEVSY